MTVDKASLIEKYVACTFCSSDIVFNDEELSCKNCKSSFRLVDGEIPSMLARMSDDTNFSMEKWDRLYQTQKEAPEEYQKLYSEDILRQALEYADTAADPKVCLEIGCGQGYLGEDLAKRGWFFIGVDFSLHALRSLKKRLDNDGIKNYLLIHGDIKALPIRTGSVGLIYGGGVIEHFKDPQPIINHLFRVLRRGGVSFNAVPFFNIGNLLYRSFWGGIPNVPILKQLAELIHVKIMKGRHMVFGYELQFTAGALKALHVRAGFTPENIIMDRFDCHIILQMIRNPRLREFARNLCKTNRQFWPMLKIIGIKK